MIRDSEGFRSVLEGKLFHGTSSATVDAICRKGFDWRLCGKHGTMYGQGMILLELFKAVLNIYSTVFTLTFLALAQLDCKLRTYTSLNPLLLAQTK